MPAPAPVEAPPLLPLGQALVAAYPALRSVPRPFLDQQLQRLPLIQVPAGTTLFHDAQPCRGLPLLIDGEVRVARVTANAREVELYRVRPGDFCILSAACLLDGRHLPAHATAAQDTSFVLLSRSQLLEWTDDRDFRAALILSLAHRISELTELIDGILSQRLEVRLAAILLRAPSTVVAQTHQAIADDLGTSREIVSRLLGRMADQGLVRLGRGSIELLRRDRLIDLAESD